MCWQSLHICFNTWTIQAKKTQRGGVEIQLDVLECGLVAHQWGKYLTEYFSYRKPGPKSNQLFSRWSLSVVRSQQTRVRPQQSRPSSPSTTIFLATSFQTKSSSLLHFRKWKPSIHLCTSKRALFSSVLTACGPRSYSLILCPITLTLPLWFCIFNILLSVLTFARDCFPWLYISHRFQRLKWLKHSWQKIQSSASPNYPVSAKIFVRCYLQCIVLRHFRICTFVLNLGRKMECLLQSQRRVNQVKRKNPFDYSNPRVEVQLLILKPFLKIQVQMSGPNRYIQRSKSEC